MNLPLSCKKFISYDLEMAQSLNNRTAAALLSRLSYWFSKYEQGFYKFMEPCSHKLYRPGDSWTEEIGVARRTLNRAFDLIGVRYKSKRLFLQEKDPFQGKMFASYVDNDTNQTFYLKNLHFFSHSSSKNLEGKKQEKGSSQNVRRATDKMTDPYKDNKKDFKEIYPPKSPLQEKRKVDDLKNERKKGSNPFLISPTIKTMVDIFKEETQNKISVPPITTHFAKKLTDSLQTFFDNCLEKWRLFCRKCASSKLLMGEGPSGFKAWLIWLVKKQVIEKVRKNQYGVDKKISLQTDMEKETERQYFQKRLKSLNEPAKNPYQKIWSNVTPSLKNKVDEMSYRTWLQPLSPVGLTSTEVILSAPSEMIKRYVEEKYGSFLRGIFETSLSRSLEVKIRVCPALRCQIGVVKEALKTT